jgi:hypothetical protein
MNLLTEFCVEPKLLMKSKLRLCLALVLSGLLTGCATNKPVYPLPRAAFPEPGIYLVQPGDSATRIAKNLCLTVGRLSELNPGVNWSHLKIGLKLHYAPETSDLTKQISDILTECQKIKPGMTRSDLLKVFTTEGGISTAMSRTFVYRGCPYIKVNVDFTPSEPAQNVLEERPTDAISMVSKPYLAWSISD